eukprot:gene17631-46827_t
MVAGLGGGGWVGWGVVGVCGWHCRVALWRNGAGTGLDDDASMSGAECACLYCGPVALCRSVGHNVQDREMKTATRRLRRCLRAPETEAGMDSAAVQGVVGADEAADAGCAVDDHAGATSARVERDGHVTAFTTDCRCVQWDGVHTCWRRHASTALHTAARRRWGRPQRARRRGGARVALPVLVNAGPHAPLRGQQQRHAFIRWVAAHLSIDPSCIVDPVFSDREVTLTRCILWCTETPYHGTVRTASLEHEVEWCRCGRAAAEWAGAYPSSSVPCCRCQQAGENMDHACVACCRWSCVELPHERQRWEFVCRGLCRAVGEGMIGFDDHHTRQERRRRLFGDWTSWDEGGAMLQGDAEALAGHAVPGVGGAYWRIDYGQGSAVWVRRVNPSSPGVELLGGWRCPAGAVTLRDLPPPARG